MTPDVRVSERVEYGVQCRVETYWPQWTGPLARFRWWRWLMTRWLVWDSNVPWFTAKHGCGKHVVVSRITRFPVPEEGGR